MPDTWQDSKIVLILKPHRELTKVANYRPISLLNQDAKSFMSTLATSLKKIIKQHTNLDQYGFGKGKQVSDLIRKF